MRTLKKKQIIIAALSLAVCLLIGGLSGGAICYQLYAKTPNGTVWSTAYKTLNSNYNDIVEEYRSYRDRMYPYEAIPDAKAALQEIVDETEKEKEEKQEEIDDLDAEIKDKKEQLQKLSGEIKEASEKPITLSSGDYTVGDDIPSGRYKISGSSNFVARDSYGDLCINTILGDDFDGDYVGNLEYGMSIHCASKTTFTPVE